MHFFIFRCQYHFFNAIVRTLNPGELNLEFCLLLVRTSDAFGFYITSRENQQQGRNYVHLSTFVYV